MCSLETFLDLVPRSLYGLSGSVFYSGRRALEEPNDLYILGLNPGGSPEAKTAETIERDIETAKAGRVNWSAYQDDRWEGRKPGHWGMQPRVLHLLRELERDPHKTPASNVVFVRSRREADLQAKKADLLAACWPVHAAVIEALGVKTIVSFGGTAGAWVREALGAHDEVDHFKEVNKRNWLSRAHRNAAGQCVLTLTHPSIANWKAPETDPTPLVRRALARP